MTTSKWCVFAENLQQRGRRGHSAVNSMRAAARQKGYRAIAAFCSAIILNGHILDTLAVSSLVAL